MLLTGWIPRFKSVRFQILRASMKMAVMRAIALMMEAV
jgi:hypothetical protein